MQTTTTHLEEPLERLLDAWNHHQDLRRTGASLDQLWTSRQEVDSRRLDLAALDADESWAHRPTT